MALENNYCTQHAMSTMFIHDINVTLIKVLSEIGLLLHKHDTHVCVCVKISQSSLNRNVTLQMVLCKLACGGLSSSQRLHFSITYVDSSSRIYSLISRPIHLHTHIKWTDIHDILKVQAFRTMEDTRTISTNCQCDCTEPSK